MLRVLLMAALLASACGASTGDEPGDERGPDGGCDFSCADGACALECDGRAECGDAADERAARCQAGAVRLTPGDEARVAVAGYAAPRHGALLAMLCDNSQCSAAALRGRAASGVLAADTGLDCNRMGRYCRLRSQAEAGEVTPLEEGDVVLTVRRSKRYLELWLDDDSVRVPVKKSYTRFQLRPSGPDKVLDVTVTAIDAPTEQPTPTPTEEGGGNQEEVRDDDQD